MKRINKFLLPILILSLVLSFAPLGASAFSNSESAEIVSNEACYSDISGGWYENWVTQYGYPDIFSKGDGCFHPDQPITRLAFARMLHEALDINIYYFAPTDIGEYFDDVTGEDAGANALYDLVTCGIIDTENSFRPLQTLDRDEMIHFIMNALYRFIGKSHTVTTMAEYLPFEDASNIKDTYKEDVAFAAAGGLVNGTTNGLLLPRKAATRAEAVTITGRLLELLEKRSAGIQIAADAKEDGGELKLSLTILNDTESTVTLNHTSTQRFDFVFYDCYGEAFYRWSEGLMFNTVLTTTEILPGEVASFSAEIDAETYAKIKDNVFFIKANIVGTSSDFDISTNGYMIF